MNDHDPLAVARRGAALVEAHNGHTLVIEHDDVPPALLFAGPFRVRVWPRTDDLRKRLASAMVLHLSRQTEESRNPLQRDARAAPGLFVASQQTAEHQTFWRALRRSGVPIASSWLYEHGDDIGQAGPGGWWARDLWEAQAASGLLLWTGPAPCEPRALGWAFCLAAVALAAHRPVGIAHDGPPLTTWQAHPLVTMAPTVEEACVALGFPVVSGGDHA